MGTGFTYIVVSEQVVEVTFLSSYAPVEGQVHYNVVSDGGDVTKVEYNINH